MSDKNYEMYVASYDDTASATDDFGALKDAKDAGDVKILASVLITRDNDGKVDVKEHIRHSGLRAVGWGAVGGLLVGLFAPELLIVSAAGVVATTVAGTEVATALAGAGAGGVLHEIRKHHEEHKIAKEVEEYFPNGSSAILVLFDDEVADRIDKILTKANKRALRAIDKGNFDKLSQVLSEAGYKVDEELAS